MGGTAFAVGPDSNGLRLTRILLAILALAPVGVLFVAARGPAVDQNTAATRELLGIDYLRALQPLTIALMGAQADAVAGRVGAATALSQAVTGMDAADDRDGDALSLRDRWRGLRAQIESLPGQGSPRSVYDAYGDTTDLLLGLYVHVQQTAGLATDPQTDTANLQRVAAVDLPEIAVGIGRFADLTRVSADAELSVAAGAELLAQRQAVNDPGHDLVESLQSAAATTSSPTLSGDVLGELDALRQSLDAVATPVPIPNRLSAADVAAADSLRVQGVRSTSALSTKVLAALGQLVGQRRDDGRSRSSRAELALVAGIVVAVLLVVVETAVFVRRRRSAPFDPTGEPVDDRGPDRDVTGRERVGAAR